ncbi:MAG: DUF3472 domain-containing protein [Akkermansiaceae bacterium]
MKYLLFSISLIAPLLAGEWTVPLAGNAFRTAPEPGNGTSRGGTLSWSKPTETYSVFFHIDKPATLELTLNGASEKPSDWKISCADKDFKVTVADAEMKEHKVGEVKATVAGYVEVKISGTKREGDKFGRISDLIVRSQDEVTLQYVKTNKGNMFYWGRRGPSVHLGYQVPKDKKIEWAYSEITVPEGEDPIGTFYMANGFGQGYFGFQVKSPTERWVLFSVWSPFSTNNPKEVPEKDRVATLATGKDVRAQKFGGEGSGGQSFLVYPWKAGKTYRFLTRVTPNGDNTTTYTAWFGDKATDEWRLITSFRRPRTDTHLTGFHSFLENFNTAFGASLRTGVHGNQWVCDTEGTWHEITRARFTADATARGGHRLDYAGGIRDGDFFLKNCGFFNERVSFDQWFEKPSNPKSKPVIDLDKLPKE